MSPVAAKFAITATIMAGAMLGGYLCRRAGLTERVGQWIMTGVAVFGYPSVSLASIWGMSLQAEALALPVLAAIHLVLITFLSLAIAPLFSADRAERGLFAVAGGIGNNGFTMGAFILYLLYGKDGLALANIYFISFLPLTVVLLYPLARHFAAPSAQGSLAGLMIRNLLDWRSIGLPVGILAIALAYLGVAPPPQIARWHIVDILVYTITPLAFFGIGLRLHGSRILPMWRLLGGLAIVRFGVGAATGLAIAWLTRLTAWPLSGLSWNVMVIESFVPTAVTSVAIANMFSLKPREASVLFVGNTLMYLLLVLPVVLWVFG